ncbi:MAG TPA: NAD(P)H-hydrate epimerase [Candidatus Nitrosocosmicus sp.]|nr:NAD(P)H-hydrate epimerase [Candidatus Nitrosocosmicus sp.]
MEIKENFNNIRGFEPISSNQMYQIENIGETEYLMKKILMMENAGSRIADFLLSEFGEKLIDKSIVAVCGRGNNGGDALVAMRHLSGYILSTNLSEKPPVFSVILLSKPNELKTSEAISNWKIIEKTSSISTLTLESSTLEEMEEEIKKSDIILDGIFGTGIKGDINEPHSSIINLINSRKNNIYVLSVDIPSGLNPDTGEIKDKTIIADATITFHRPKHGHINAASVVGKLVVKKIGIPYETENGVV